MGAVGKKLINNLHFRIFFISFLFAVLAFWVIRTFVIDFAFGASTDGHLAGDPLVYHEIAVRMSTEIGRHGWGAFELRPEGHGPAGVVSILYFAGFGQLAIIFLMAFLHAVSVVCFFSILRLFFSSSASVFGVFPVFFSVGMIVWYSQINKDSFVLLGVSLVFLGVLRFFTSLRRSVYFDFVSVFFVSLGALLVWVVRPYLNMLLLPGAVMSVSVFLFWQISNGVRLGRDLSASAALLSLCILCLASLVSGAASDQALRELSVRSDPSNVHDALDDPENYGSNGVSVDFQCLNQISVENWRSVDWVPDVVDRNVRAIMGHRCMIFSILRTHSDQNTINAIVHEDILPGGFVEAIRYFPSGFLLGIFSPFASDWMYFFFVGASYFFLVSSVESFFLHFGIVPLIFYACRKRSLPLILLIIWAFSVMGVYGVATPFLGALYRYRFPFWILLLCIMAALAYDWRARRRF